MKTNFKTDTIRQLILQFPVEIALSIVMAITISMSIRSNNPEQIVTPALALAVAWWVNSITRDTSHRWIYYISWIPVFPIATILEYDIFATTILCQLFVMLAFSSRDNRLFAPMQFGLALESIVVGILYQIAFALLIAITASTDYLFKTSITQNATIYFIIPTTIICAVALFLYRTEMRRKSIEATGNRALSILSNYILSPAIIVYAAIIYLYIASIIVKWELPQGNISIMILSFTTIYFAARAIGENSASKIFRPLYKHITLIALPMQIMLWVAIARRVIEYGFTEWRIILIVAASITSKSLIAINSKRYGRYQYILAAITATTLLLSIKSPFSPREISLRSQSKIAYELAQQMEILDNNDTIDIDLAENLPDKLNETKQLLSIINYIEKRLDDRDRADYLWFFENKDRDALYKIRHDMQRRTNFR